MYFYFLFLVVKKVVVCGKIWNAASAMVEAILSYRVSKLSSFADFNLILFYILYENVTARTISLWNINFLVKIK